MAEAVSDTETSAVLHHRSPGVTAIYNELKISNANRVLDLGTASAASFRFFTQLSCQVHFESLDEFLAEHSPERHQGPELLTALDLYLTHFNPEHQFDVILTWDLFNYLDLPSIEWLVRRLTEHCRKGALLHSIQYLSPNIPAQPVNFQVLDQYQLQLNQPTAKIPRPYPRHESAKLLRHLPDYYIENAYLNHEGMVPGMAEQVLRLQPEKAQTVRRQASDELIAPHNTLALERQQQGSQEHKSQALDKVLGQLQSGEALLDLGLKNKQNYDFLHHISENIYAESLYDELQLQIKQQLTPQLKPHMLNFAADTQFSVILTWDLLNFLPLPQIEEVFSKLLAHSRPGTLVHAILYSGREVPCAPQQFLLKAQDSLSLYPTAKQPCAQPLTSSGLLKALKVFRLQDTFVFRPGMQRGLYEYIFVRQ